MDNIFLDNIFLKKEWQDINKCFVGLDKLTEWIRNYFNVEEDMNNFERRNRGYLELRSLDKSRGYVFVGEIQLNRDYEGRMRDAKGKDYFNKTLIREFVDHDNKLAGFSWRAKNGR